MDGLPLGKLVIFVHVALCALSYYARSHIIPGRYQFSGFHPLKDKARSFHHFSPYNRLQYNPWNSWNGGTISGRRLDIPYAQPQEVPRRFRNNYIPRVHINYDRRPISYPARTRSFRTYDRQIVHRRPVILEKKLEDKPKPKPKKISIINGPLNQVIPHPKPRNIKAKKKMRYRMVAKAKSFPGILKDTSLDVTKARIRSKE